MNESEFNELFRTTYPRLVALGLAMSTPLHVAQELAQETMIRANDHRDRLSDFDAPYAWCRRVMSNLLIDQHRSRTAERSAIDQLAHGPTACDASHVADADPTESSDAWAEMIKPLTWRQRCVATLYYGEDRSVADIADDLGLSTGSVKTTLARVRRKVARQLAANAENEEIPS